MQLLERDFFARAPDDVARDLVGVHMTLRRSHDVVVVRLVETEAYGGDDDPASHAFRGRTARNAAMFGPAGHLYVYRVYGIHWCMNIVTGQQGEASAVLLRAAELVTTSAASPTSPLTAALRGPGNLTKALGVTGEDDGLDCCGPNAQVAFSRGEFDSPLRVGRSARIGISRARERLSRYYLEGSPAVTKLRLQKLGAPD